MQEEILQEVKNMQDGVKVIKLLFKLVITVYSKMPGGVAFVNLFKFSLI